MRTLPLLLVLIVPLAAEEPVKPRVTLGTTALLAKENALAVFFSPDSNRIGIVDGANLPMWDLASGQFHHSRYCGKMLLGIQRLAFSSDGLFFAGHNFHSEKYCLFRHDPMLDDRLTFELEGRPDTILLSESALHVAIEQDNRTRVLRTADGETVTVFAKLDNLRRFSASQDGKAFAFCNRDGVVHLRTAGGLAWSPIPKDKHKFASAALTPDGARLATASFREDDDGRKVAGPVQVWSMTERKLLTECAATEWFAEYPNRLRFTPDGKTILAGDGAFLRGWNAENGQRTFAVEPGWNYPGPIIVSPNGRFAAVAYAKRAMVWDLTTGRPPPGFEGHTGPVWEILFSPDGSRAATSSYGLQHIHVWDPRGGRHLHELNAPFDRGRSVPVASLLQTATATAANGEKPAGIIPGRIRAAFTRDGTGLATFNEATGAFGPLRFWNVRDGTMEWEAPYGRAVAPELAFAQHRLLMAPTRFDPRDIPLPEADKSRIVPIENVFRGMIVNRKGDRIACETTTQRDCPVFDAAGAEVDRFDGIPHTFSPDGRGLVILKLGPEMTNGTFNDLIVTRDLTAKKDGPAHKVPMGTAVGKLSPDGAFRVVVKSTELLEEQATQAFEFRETAGDRVVSTAARCDNRQSDGDRQARLLAMSVMAPPHRPVAHAFSADGRLFAAVYATGLLAVWDVATGEDILVAETQCPTPKFVAFAPDSCTVFTASGEGAGGPVLGYDTTGANLKFADLGGPAAKARKAVYELATKPEDAMKTATAILAPTTDADRKQHTLWIANLGSKRFAEREAASKSLADAGWRVETQLKEALATTGSDEVRQRLTALLASADVRPLRAVHLLELVGTPAARAELAKLAAAAPDTFTTREARRALARLSAP